MARVFLLAVLFLCLGGCGSYVTPGAAVDFSDFDRLDIAAEAARRPTVKFPVRLMVVRVQASGYRSHSSSSYGSGRFSVVTTQDLADEKDIERVAKWPQVAGLVSLSRLLLSENLRSLDDLRLAAAKVQADMMLIYTIDTEFEVQGAALGPLTTFSFGLFPDRNAKVTATGSSIFVDVRSGFIYGVSEATSQGASITNAWGSDDTVDRIRRETEHGAFRLLLDETEKTWKGIIAQYNR